MQSNFFLDLFKGSGKLVRAGGSLETALDTFQGADDLIKGLSFCQRGYAFQITVAAAQKFYFFYCIVVIVCFDRDLLRADADRFVSVCHLFYSP